MKRITFAFAIIILFACNQSKDKNKKEEPGDIDTIKTKILNADTSVMNPDTTTVTVSLENFWVLESVNNELLNPDAFTAGLPYMQINLAERKVSGYAGCNGMNGSVTRQGNNILFGKITTSKNSCNNIDFENRYLKDLSGQKIAYTIQNGKLFLKASPGTEYIYRKIQ